MLKEIAIVTISVANLGQVQEAWQESLGYQVTESGKVSDAISDLWNAPEMEGKDYVLMAPANGAPTYIRFVANESAADLRPMTSHGWNATELLVRDTDSVAAELRKSAFTVVGEPKNLWPAPDAPRAMQARGPGNELLYLTTNAEASTALRLDDTMPLVERAFILVAGGPSMAAFQSFYGQTLGMPVAKPMDFPISMISKANDLPLDTTYPLALATAAPGYMIELDEMPATVAPRKIKPGHLPPGIAIVSFNVDELPADKLDWYTKPRVIEEFPYAGRQAGILQGPAGELIEIIAAKK